MGRRRERISADKPNFSKRAKGASFRHPEAKPTEVFIGNCASNTLQGVRWATARLGTVPYNFEGEPLEVSEGCILRPIFVQKEEITTATLNEDVKQRMLAR